jgi:hypothetical protein
MLSARMTLVVSWLFPAAAARPPEGGRLTLQFPMKNVRRRPLGHVFHRLNHASNANTPTIIVNA